MLAIDIDDIGDGQFQGSIRNAETGVVIAKMAPTKTTTEAIRNIGRLLETIPTDIYWAAVYNAPLDRENPSVRDVLGWIK